MNPSTKLLLRRLTLACSASCLVGLAAAALIDRVSADEPSGQQEATESERFDKIVREDIFAGFDGDEEAMKRGLAKCDEILEKQPEHAEAMVWRGAARVYLAGLAFSRNDAANGMRQWTAGLADMDQAVKLEPENTGVRIPRAAVLMPAAAGAPSFMSKPLLEKAKEDFEYIYKSQEKFLDQLGEHPKGELRMGLADVYRRLGQAEASEAQLKAVQRELPDSEYAERATKWLATDAKTKLVHNCIGCHSE
jgi:tetratricopeptide (TPR) repeat protein